MFGYLGPHRRYVEGLGRGMEQSMESTVSYTVLRLRVLECGACGLGFRVLSPKP